MNNQQKKLLFNKLSQQIMLISTKIFILICTKLLFYLFELRLRLMFKEKFIVAHFILCYHVMKLCNSEWALIENYYGRMLFYAFGFRRDAGNLTFHFRDIDSKFTCLWSKRKTKYKCSRNMQLMYAHTERESGSRTPLRKQYKAEN